MVNFSSPQKFEPQNNKRSKKNAICDTSITQHIQNIVLYSILGLSFKYIGIIIYKKKYI